jgi:hypothetical protein
VGTDTAFAGEHYLVEADADGKVWYYYPLKQADAAKVVLADGWTTHGSETAGRSWGKLTWIRTAEPVGEFEFRTPPTRTLVGYKLKNPGAQSEQFPAYLTVAEWVARGFDDDGDEAFMASRMYGKEWEETDSPPATLSTSALTPLAGAPDPNAGRSWTAHQPGSLIFSRNYWHLLPGEASGFRMFLLERLRAEFGGAVTYHEYRNEMTVELWLRYDTPRWRTQPIYTPGGRKTGKTRQVEVFHNIKIPVTAGDVVTGSDKAAAYARFTELADGWVEYIRSHQMTVCSHCGGDGAVEVKG